VTAANHFASMMGPGFNANCDLRDRLGCESLAAELEITAGETRNLVLADWAATGDCGMYKQMLIRGERAIAARLKDNGVSIAEAERTICDVFRGYVFSVKPSAK
jgi:hypothetical protein